MKANRAAAVVCIILGSVGLATAQTQWVESPDNPLIESAPAGTWGEGGHWVTSVVFDGTTYHMWFTGLDEEQSWDGIGHATSADGEAWTMVLLAVLAVIGGLWRRSVTETRRASAANLLSLGRVQLEVYPTGAVAHAIASLELADSTEARHLALEALWL